VERERNQRHLVTELVMGARLVHWLCGGLGGGGRGEPGQEHDEQKFNLMVFWKMALNRGLE